MTIVNLELVKRLFRRPSSKLAPGTLAFACNICGAHNDCLALTILREGGACNNCGATLRFRSLAAALTQRLFGVAAILDELEAHRDIRGVGMSDALCYSTRLSSRFDYTNTFFHCEPFLDITKPGEHWIGTNDFVISSDVFEHVAPPIQRAFDNMAALLKPGGVAIFSVPYSLENDTHEHFPNLHEFNTREESEGVWVLDNVTVQGQVEKFRNLAFHGGPGTTLEMRLFSLAALRHHFEEAGFVDFRVHNDMLFAHGIFWLQPWGVTISAMRPQS